MAPIINISESDFERASKILELARINYTSPSKEGFVYVPSINLWVAKERKFCGENWFNSHKKLQAGGERMPTIPEFIEFLKYSKGNFPEIYKEITEVRAPRRAEWLDADFKVKDKRLYVNSNHVLDEKGNLVPKNSELLDERTLMKDRTPGISLESWLANPTKQGLPPKETKSGDLFYWCPRSEDNSVARFFVYSDWVGFSCYGFPSDRGADLGVRAVKKQE
ncbi:MAG: hypothetical protein ABIH28_02045 [archaeon]